MLHKVIHAIEVSQRGMGDVCLPNVGHRGPINDPKASESSTGIHFLRVLSKQGMPSNCKACEQCASVWQRSPKSTALRGVIIALAWLLQKEPVTAPIITTTRITHLDDAIGALAVRLTEEDVTYLEEREVPHPVVGPQKAS